MVLSDGLPVGAPEGLLVGSAVCPTNVGLEVDGDDDGEVGELDGSLVTFAIDVTVHPEGVDTTQMCHHVLTYTFLFFFDNDAPFR